MSWIPPSSATYDPQSRTAPRPGASAPLFTFGRSVAPQLVPEKQEQGAAQAPRANFDPPVESLRWWQQPRNVATVSGTSNADVEAFWAQAAGKRGVVEELCNSKARLANKSQGVGSTVAASLADHEQFSLAGARSSYKDDLCAAHVPVGKRGVALPPAAMAAFEESRQQAQRNKLVGKATNMKLSIF